jgi:hypothetical protein
MIIRAKKPKSMSKLYEMAFTSKNIVLEKMIIFMVIQMIIRNFDHFRFIFVSVTAWIRLWSICKNSQSKFLKQWQI